LEYDDKEGILQRMNISLKEVIFNNLIVETIIVLLVSSIFVILKITDKLFQSNTKYVFLETIHIISQDQLSSIRETQIKFLFRRVYKLSNIHIKLAGGSYWMSIPCIIEGIDTRTKEEKKYMGKIINNRSALMHKYMTKFRNLGSIAERTDFFFEDHKDAKDLVEFERDNLVKLKNASVVTPEVYGLHKLNFDDYILVMEYIDGEPLSKVPINDVIIDQIFRTIKTMHDNGVVHGDIKLDNFLYSKGNIVVVDCLKLNENELERAQDFDLICAICALAQEAPVNTILDHASKYYSDEELRRSANLIGITLNKVDLNLSETTIKEITDLLA
jgi:tRNA A-37 threonylcarbamoyl transferase component Bud32